MLDINKLRDAVFHITNKSVNLMAISCLIRDCSPSYVILMPSTLDFLHSKSFPEVTGTYSMTIHPGFSPTFRRHQMLTMIPHTALLGPVAPAQLARLHHSPAHAEVVVFVPLPHCYSRGPWSLECWSPGSNGPRRQVSFSS